MAVGTGSEADCCDGDCLGRIPYASVLALVLCWIGVGLFCGFLYPAINSSVRQAEDILQLNVPFLEHIRLAFIIVCVLMVLFSLILVILGAVATGQNRQRIYGGWTSRIGGRVANGIFMGLTYLLYLSWLGAFSIVSVLTFCYSLMSNLCPKQFVAGKEQCWNLSKFAGLFGDNSVAKTIIICATNLQKFCTLTETATPWYTAAYVGCVLVLLGLVHFLCCMSANCVHIARSHQYQQMEEIKQEFGVQQEMKTFQSRSAK